MADTSNPITDAAKAEVLLRQQLTERPDDPEVLTRLAMFLCRTNRAAEAISHMRRAAELDPQPARHNDLGSLYVQSGDLSAAAACYREALRLNPNYALACLNLADTLAELRQTDEAIPLYHRAIALAPPHPQAQLNLAVTLLNAGRAAEAMDACRFAIAARPLYALAHHTLAVALQKQGRTAEAITAENEALRLNPDFAKGWHTLGNLLDAGGKPEQARQALRRALALNPAFTEAAFDLGALDQTAAPPAMPVPYVRRLFDGYAPDFDHHLVSVLQYHVPELLQSLVAHHAPRGTSLDILDLGCGTGLVGRQFRAMASTLTGVDLSPVMIQSAQNAGIYDRLMFDEVSHYLAACQDQFDLILAADLFIYIGDLAQLFAGAAAVLGAQGLLAFSIETIDTPDWLLRRTRRYAHSVAYIQRLARQHSMETLAITPTPIRLENAIPIPGHLVLLRAASRFA